MKNTPGWRLKKLLFCTEKRTQGDLSQNLCVSHLSAHTFYNGQEALSHAPVLVSYKGLFSPHLAIYSYIKQPFYKGHVQQFKQTFPIHSYTVYENNFSNHNFPFLYLGFFPSASTLSHNIVGVMCLQAGA